MLTGMMVRSGRRSRVSPLRWFALVIGFFAPFALPPLPAMAAGATPSETDEPASRSTAPAATPKTGTLKIGGGISPFDQQILDANKLFASEMAGGVLDAAVAGYRKAIAIDPANPDGYLYLAGALFYRHDYVPAGEALAAGIDRARIDKTRANTLGKLLFMQATVRESIGNVDEIKTAWVAYAEFTKDYSDTAAPKGAGDAPPVKLKTYPAVAPVRLAKFDAFARQTAEYVKVKELVLKRQKELGIEVDKSEKGDKQK